jgi:hypothetical protein
MSSLAVKLSKKCRVRWLVGHSVHKCEALLAYLRVSDLSRFALVLMNLINFEELCVNIFNIYVVTFQYFNRLPLCVTYGLLRRVTVREVNRLQFVSKSCVTPRPKNAVRISGRILRPLACRDYGLESCRGRGCLLFCECCVLSGRGPCDGLITRP